MTPTPEGTLLWQPNAALRHDCILQAYMDWLAKHQQLHFDGYQQLWEWSTTQIEDFWASIWEFFDVQASAPYAQVLAERTMPGAQWFVGARLNYAEHIFRNRTADRPAMLFQSETQPLTELSWDELERQVASVAAALRDHGRGQRRSGGCRTYQTSHRRWWRC